MPLENEVKRSIWPFFVFGLLLMALFLGVNFWLLRGDSDPEPEEAARSEVRIKNLAELRADDQAKLTNYAWLDRAKGTVQIPIDQAMVLAATQLASSQPRPAYPVQPPVEAPAAAPAATETSTTPSADAAPAATPAAPVP